MKHILYLLLIVSLFSCTTKQIELETDSLSLRLDDNGKIIGLIDKLRDIVTDINNSIEPEYRSRIVYYPFNEPDGGGVKTKWLKI